MLKRNSTTIDDLLSHLRTYFLGKSVAYKSIDDKSRKEIDDKPPLRAEIFTRDQLDGHAAYLSSYHKLSEEKQPEVLLKRLSENEEVLIKVTELLHDAVKDKKRISPAGEWLLDNFYLIEEQILTGKRYLPKGYSRGLPRLKNTHAMGIPRVYDIALEIISHSDGHVDLQSLTGFIRAYQKKTELTIGELWAIPIMLRLALLENLSRVAAKIAIDKIDENLADFWADKMLHTAETDPKNLVLVIADLARANPPMVSAFVAPFTQRLQWKGSEMIIVLSWLEQHLSEKGMSISTMSLAENQQQAANQVSMSNSISSLRFLAKMDWREFVENMSVTEQVLRTDINRVYEKMDFYTRDIYRHAVEKIALRTKLPEKEIAILAIKLAEKAHEENKEDDRKSHVGYYLIGKGLPKTEAAARQLGSDITVWEKTKINFHKYFYGLTIILITALVSGLLFFKAYDPGLNKYLLVFIGILIILCSSQLAIQFTNWLATLIVKPQPLPRLDFCKGIPPDFKTMVVVPCMLVNHLQIEKLLEELEVRFLANRETNLYFALLSDFTDADQQHMPADEINLQHAIKGIEALNKKYAEGEHSVFYLFHRQRVWNKKEKCWMGWERKRGKLAALNNLLRGEQSPDFISILGDTDIFTEIKYVITLDADTQLPREAAWKLVGIMAHPLNKPVLDANKNIVINGYGIVQPRIAISLHGTVRSLYTRMHENDSGIDPYTRVTSNVYQDVFAEGSFIGKGIYDVDVFAKVLHHRFPENKILSHDLLEGAYTRCAFASDVQFYEDYPAKYRVDMNRRHRWIRGDWQIANWILPFVPNGENKLVRNPVSVLSKWKIFDNLRRSIMPISLLALLLCGWTFLKSPWFWTIAVIAIVLLTSIIASVWNLLKKPNDVKLQFHISNSAAAVYRNITEAIFTLVCLPYEAYISLDAIMRSTWRMLITKRKLLEWNPYGFDQNTEYKNLLSVYISMWPTTFITASLIIYLLFYSHITLLLASPFIIAWALSPTIVWWLSLPLVSGKANLNEKQKLSLRKLSRKTWAFFENFVGPEDNWLPPDNFQQHPITILAHRTSPTNIGLALICNLAAHDFGYITTDELNERLENTFATLHKLERYNGHFYNWYDTVSLQPLYPRYISVVDSGNLAAHLITLKQGLFNLPHSPILSYKNFWGTYDSLQIVCEHLKKENKNECQKLLDSLLAFCENTATHLFEFKTHLDDFAERLNVFYNTVSGHDESELYWWITAMQQNTEAIYESLKKFTPWVFQKEIPLKFKEHPLFFTIPNLVELSELKSSLHELSLAEGLSTAEREWLAQMKDEMYAASGKGTALLLSIQKHCTACEHFSDFTYDFLYDTSQHLFVIGYNVEEHRRDASCYDLLASEARLASFVAIAQGKVPQENWFALGRRLTNQSGIAVLLSWSGSMFEYLMPNLVMPTYESTLLDNSNKGVVKRQIEYGRQHNTSWGISESCYNVVDAQLNYQYRAFGVPGLGLKRGLGKDYVIAPYASVMALMVDAPASYDNIERMIAKGYQGKYGLYEAVDFTASRLPRGLDNIVIQTFMAHHLGMSFLSLAYVLLDQPMQKRFEAEPRFQATLLLLQEQIPKATNYYSAVTEISENTQSSVVSDIRVIKTANTAIPEVQLLSNGNYHVMVTNAGGGYSRWKDKLVTRWKEDTTRDNWGMFCFIKDVQKNNYWSNAWQPSLKEPKVYESIFSQGRAEFRRIDHKIETHTEIIVSPEDDVEIRRIQVSNRGNQKRELEITSYAEVVMNIAEADHAHPAFSNLFVETQIAEPYHSILCKRRPRSKDEIQPWMFHQFKMNDKQPDSISYETDRSKFIGRGNNIINPAAMQEAGLLSNTVGSVLDPVVAIRYRFILDAEETISFDIINGVAETEETVNRLLEKYQDKHFRDRAFELSWTHSQVTIRQINASEADAQLYGKMASSVIYGNPYLRAEASLLLKNHMGQSALWSYSISGDLPIVLLQISSTENIKLVKQMIQAKEYWQLKGLSVDLFIWNEDESGYRQTLQEQVQNMVSANISFNTAGRQGGIFVRPLDQISPDDRILLQAVARVIISDKKGTLADQLNKKSGAKNKMPPFIPSLGYNPLAEEALPVPERIFFNGFGGFSASGHEYIITSKKETPAPWVNIIANKKLGTVISERGSSYTWFENAHEYRLTPWHNDPVSDGGGEAFYIRDERTGYFWSPMPFPAKGRNEYIIKHGFGYSVFENLEAGIQTDAEVFVDTDAAIKFVIINLQNLSDDDRKLSLTGYVEWILGDLQAKTGMHIITEYDALTGTFFAYNNYNKEFEGRVSFFNTDEPVKNFTANRTEFLGRNGCLQKPEAMQKEKLSGKYGAGLNSCASLQMNFNLAHQEKKQIIFRLGAAKNKNEAIAMLKQFKGATAVIASLNNVHDQWKRLLTRVQVQTPDNAFNFLANGWLLYQNIACRLWGRSGFYQSGGAYGFRDQLQDILAAMHAEESLARSQIILAASRQFKEGDVQHWWHPPLGRGVRTHCSDDYLWLPYTTARYITYSGDVGILQEPISFLEGRLLNADEESYYDLPNISSEKTSLYDHCKRALQHGFRYGVHGLPLIGAGDWNDGMNLVGKEGKGESVWLAFFLYDVIRKFKEIAILQKDDAFITECEKQAEKIKENIQANAWDGDWYLRAFFDDGTPLGSSKNEECKIDSISQSWSVISGAGDEERTRKGMESLYTHLVRKEDKLIQLLNPPFNKSNIDPGYIKGYVPGVRENGGQYTHAAVWTVMAYAKMKNEARTWDLLQMLNPVNHGKDEESIGLYKTEPYVMAADVYGVAPHTGQGGWTWYTGSAGWYYQLMIESLMGLYIENDKLFLNPCIPPQWDDFKMQYRYKNTVYEIQYKRQAGKAQVELDGSKINEKYILLQDDQKPHSVIYYFH